jgi:hypothetical protein
MLYEITYVRSGKTETFTGSRMQCQALADYLSKTFRITANIRRAA